MSAASWLPRMRCTLRGCSIFSASSRHIVSKLWLPLQTHEQHAQATLASAARPEAVNGTKKPKYYAGKTQPNALYPHMPAATVNKED